MKLTEKNKVSRKSLKKANLELAKYIDHTMLKPDATHAELKKLCEEAKKYSFKGVCVNSSNIKYVAKILKNTAILPVAVVGFPLGASTSKSKAYEAKNAVLHGALEIDMVINIGALKSKDYKTVVKDIKKVVKKSKPATVKVIIETATLTDEEKIIACALAKGSGAAFVKTSTGFSSNGATVADIELMRRVVGPEIGVKASGGIKTLEIAEKMLKAGADRLGCSSSIAIVEA
ncbi:MAG: deoxyribose-phosphate aldolase [bacterium]|nr:deoxyribose-phosphate aldolase [bacterium]